MNNHITNKPRRDYDKEPLQIEDCNPLFMWWQTIFFIIPLGTIIVLLNPFEVNLSETVSKMIFMIPLAALPIYRRYKNSRGHRKVVLKNDVIFYYHDNYEITRINLDSIKSIYKTYDDFYHVSQELNTFYKILMILFFPFLLLNKFVLLFIKAFRQLTNCGLHQYKFYDAVMITGVDNKVLTILPSCQNERNEIKEYFMSKKNINTEQLGRHFSFLYSLEKIKIGDV